MTFYIVSVQCDLASLAEFSTQAKGLCYVWEESTHGNPLLTTGYCAKHGSSKSNNKSMHIGASDHRHVGQLLEIMLSLQ